MSTERLAAVRACWHPVAYAEAVTGAHATTLLGEPLVLWRDRRRAVHAFRDVCVHRGTALSLGCVDGDEIVCAYHGWRYGADGACTAIPQLAEPTRVPARARATTYATCERYGIVWVALDAPTRPVPDVPNTDRLPRVCGRRAERRDTPDALRAAPAVHDRRAHRLGRRRSTRLLLRLAAGRRRSLRRLLPRGAQLQPRPARRRHPGVRADAAELHLTFDAVAVAYRRAMRAHGFG